MKRTRQHLDDVRRLRARLEAVREQERELAGRIGHGGAGTVRTTEAQFDAFASERMRIMSELEELRKAA